MGDQFSVFIIFQKPFIRGNESCLLIRMSGQRVHDREKIILIIVGQYDFFREKLAQHMHGAFPGKHQFLHRYKQLFLCLFRRRQRRLFQPLRQQHIHLFLRIAVLHFLQFIHHCHVLQLRRTVFKNQDQAKRNCS